MDPFHFACPHCSSRLRVREKLYVGRQVDCPECGDTLLIVERPDGLGVERIECKLDTAPSVPPGKSRPPEKTALLDEPPDAADKGRKSAAATVRPAAKPVGEPAAKPGAGRGAGAKSAAPPTDAAPRSNIPSPALVGVGLVVVLLVAILAIVFYPRGNQGPPSDGLPETIAAEGSDKPAIADGAPPAPLEKPRDDVELRLSRLGDSLLDYASQEKAFPQATVPANGIAPENRLGWMAVLADRLDDDSAPTAAWDRPWNDPQNDAFARRRLTVFQNPLIAQLTGDDGYPAAHFAGVAGVGADAARLDRRDPRAGIFGYDRTTRQEDIRDGAANTLLVLGVRERLGSWAAGGPATVRGLARQPYINGPDGFGTGSPDSMLVLMADGRVLTVTPQTEPRIVRRMAAMADGFSLDESEEGEPGDRPSLLAADEPPDRDAGAAAAVQAAEAPGAVVNEQDLDPEDRPIDPEFAPEPPVEVARKIDLAVSLKQPIARFDQPRSKPLEDVLISVAEMAGARLVFDRDELGPAAARLSEPMALKLENTTVGDILAELLRPAGLMYRVENDHLRVVVKE